MGSEMCIRDRRQMCIRDRTKFGLKQIPKDCNIWKFFANNDQVVINGNLLIKKPHDRLEIKI